jgi:hypothetical protein
MKSSLFLIVSVFLFSITSTIAQSNDIKGNKSVIDNITYRLYPTENMWTFIKLNTRNGIMWQVQFDAQSNNRFETNLNTIPLIDKENEDNGRFTLYPTQNLYNFMLLDQIDGRVWQAQWSDKPENRGIVLIN